MCSNLRMLEIITCIIISLIVTVLIIMCGNVETSNFVEGILTIFPSLAGFSITGYIFIITSMHSMPNDSQEKDPYSVLCAMFAFTILVQLISISLAFILESCNYKLCIFSCYLEKCKLLQSILCIISIFALLLTINLVFHLFPLRTFFRHRP